MSGSSASPDETQKQRFEQAARELGVELDEAKLTRVLRQLGPGASVNETPGSLGFEAPVTNGTPVRDDS